MRNPWVISTAAAAGLRTVLWSNLPGDWRPKPVTWLEHRMEPIAKRAEAIGLPARSPGMVRATFFVCMTGIIVF